MRKVDFTFPLPDKNLHKRYDPVFDNLKKGLSTTVVGLPLSSRSAFLKFVLENGNEYLSKYIDIEKFDFLIINQKHSTDSDLLKDLIIRIADKLGVQLPDNYDPLLIQFKLEKLVNNSKAVKKLVLFIPDFDSLLKGKPETIEFLIRLGEINKHNIKKPGILFCFTASSKEIEHVTKSYPYKFAQVITEAVVSFELLTSEEIEYTKKRLEYFRGSKIAENSHRLSVKLSGGHYILYKTLTGLDTNEILKVNKTFYHPLIGDIIFNIWNSASTPEQKKLLVTSPIFPPRKAKSDLSNNDVLPLTAQENDVFENFKGHLEILITRDEIGQIMWSKNWTEKYSDWAIDKLISKLKSKLIYSNYKILSVRGRGYKLINYAG